MTEINKTQVKNIASKSETANAVFTVLAARERSKSVTDLKRLNKELHEEGFKVVPTEFADTFMELAKIGVGKLIKRPGQPDRFQWNFKLKDISALAISGQAKPGVHPKAEVSPDAATSLKVILPSGALVEFPPMTAQEAAWVSNALIKHLK